MADLTDAQRDVLVTLVVRGMARGEASADHQALADQGLLLIKGPIIMPTPDGTALAGEELRLADDAAERERLMTTWPGPALGMSTSTSWGSECHASNWTAFIVPPRFLA